MKKIKRIEILDGKEENPRVLIDLPDILKLIHRGKDYYWGVLPVFDPMGIHEKDPQKVADKIRGQISEKGFAVINWEDLMILARGVCQFFDLLLIGCKDCRNLKNYEDDEEMLRECDIVIIMFDTCWWEVSCKDEALMNKFIGSFKEVRIVTE